MTLFEGHPLLVWRRQWHPTPVLLPGESCGRRSLVGCSPWGRQSRTGLSNFTFTFHFSLSCTGEGNGNPLQCSCLENPRDGEAWWASVYGVAQSRTRLMRFSSSSSIIGIAHSMQFPKVGNRIRKQQMSLCMNSKCIFPVAQMVKNLPAMQETQVRSLGQEDPLEKGMAIHSSILSWRVLWTEEPGGLQLWGPKQLDRTE